MEVLTGHSKDWGDEGFKTFHWGGTGFAIHKSSEAVDVAKKLLELAYFSYEGHLQKLIMHGLIWIMKKV